MFDWLNTSVGSWSGADLMWALVWFFVIGPIAIHIIFAIIWMICAVVREGASR